MTVDLDARAAGARRLEGKVCVVTGAGQGIGRATARRLGQEGGRIVVADRVDESASVTDAGCSSLTGKPAWAKDAAMSAAARTSSARNS